MNKYLLFVSLLILPGYGFSQWTWLNPLPQGNSLHAIQFVNSTTAYAAGDGGTVLKTMDAGNTWTRLNTGILYDFRGLFFLNADTGWVVGFYDLYVDGVILKTTDGGISWSINWTQDEEEDNIFFTDANNGYLQGFNWMYKSTDGGNTWTILYPPWGAGVSLFFTDPQTGYIATGYLDKTVDGGSTWMHILPAMGVISVFFCNHQKGYAIGMPNKIYRTIDAGNTWDTLSSGTSKSLWSGYFSDTIHGYCIGDSGLIIRTIDGGQSWSVKYNGVSNLTSMYFTTH